MEIKSNRLLFELLQGCIRLPFAFLIAIQLGCGRLPASLPSESPIVTQYPTSHTLCADDSIVVVLQSRTTSLGPENISTP